MKSLTDFMLSIDHNKYSKSDLEKIHYASKTIISELIKFILLLLFSVIVADFISFIYITITLLFLRPFSGGLHFRSHISCFIFSVLFYSIILFIPQTLISAGPALIIFLLSLSIIAAYSPMPSAKRPSYSVEQQTMFRSIAVLSVLACAIVYFLFFNQYMNLVLLTVFFQSLQLLITKEVKVHVEKKYKS
ncbi:MAG: accessory gene regulator B family protein [Clostridia bacterium]|nr:accessory gene regulator B family protein [Clostridia bacterium]